MVKQGVHETISRLLSDRLQRRLSLSLSRETCLEIYQDIFFTISEIIKESQTPLCNESVNLLAQMYYDSVVINNGQELDPNIFTKRASADQIPTKELALMATMMNGTVFGDFFIAAVKKRS